MTCRMKEVIMRIETLNETPQSCGQCDALQRIVCAVRYEQTIEQMMLRVGRPGWCPILGVLPDEHGDLIDRDVLYMAVKSHDTSDAAIVRNHGRVTSLQNISTMKKGYIAEKHICLDDIIRAKAVIAAERKDDGNT